MSIAAAWLVMSGVNTFGKAYQQTQAAKQRIKALEFESKQSALAHTQELISNYDILERTISMQQAEASTRGFALNSPSMEAIERDTINKANKAAKNIELEESLFQKNIKVEKKSVKKSLFANLFGDIATTGFDFAKYSSSVPSNKG